MSAMDAGQDFIRSLSEAVGGKNSRMALEAFDLPPSVSVRGNPEKCGRESSSEELLSKNIGAHLSGIPWSPFGFMLDSRPVFTLDPLLHAGAYYVQDSSAMYVGHVFRRILKKRGFVRVLDLCAAPGGKTTDIAASLRAVCGDDFVLVANEVMSQRASVLADNVGRWGDPNVIVTSADPRAFAQAEAYFDVIVADVPCSGEGMFRKDPEALRQWSMDNVALCEARQRRIVADVWPALAEGGVFVYSTCTFNLRENDGNVLWIAREMGAEILTGNAGLLETGYDAGKSGEEGSGENGRWRLSGESAEGVLVTECGYLLLPGLVKGEGQYCAALAKTGGRPGKSGRHCGASGKSHGKSSMSVKTSLPPGLFKTPVVYRNRGALQIAVPESIAAEADFLSLLNPIRVGTAAGEMKGKDFVPHADLCLSSSFNKDAFPKVEVDRTLALRFLGKEAISLPEAEKGLILLAFEGLPLGFAKNLGTRCNNLLPKDRRIRMDLTEINSL